MSSVWGVVLLYLACKLVHNIFTPSIAWSSQSEYFARTELVIVLTIQGRVGKSTRNSTSKSVSISTGNGGRLGSSM